MGGIATSKLTSPTEVVVLSDVGWLVITGAEYSWECRVAIPNIHYSKLGNAVVWEDYGKCSVLL